MMGPRSWSRRALLMLCAACALVAACSQCLCQMQQPLMGQGAPVDVPAKIYVTAFMERLLEVDEKNYRFENIVYLYLTWEDSRAMGARANATQAIKDGTKETCNRPCDSSGSMLNQETAGASDFCCDGVWLPTVNIMNVYELPEGRTQQSGIVIQDARVGWYTAVHCIYFSPMDFERFPFDTQELVMQFRSPRANINAMPVSAFVPSATSTRWLVEGKGDIVSGWDVKSLDVRPTMRNMQEMLDYFIGNFGEGSSLEDPLPVAVLEDECFHYFENETVAGFDIVVKVERFSSYFITNMFVPILLLVVLSFITYAIPPQYLDARVALNVTLFLSLTALQFVINDQLPKSSYPTTVTQLIVICYVIVALAIPESLVVYTLDARARKHQGKVESEADKALSVSERDLETGDGPSAEPSQQSTKQLLSKRLMSMHKERPKTLAKWIDRGMMATMVVVVIVALVVIRTKKAYRQA